jgi:hypothetical protein
LSWDLSCGAEGEAGAKVMEGWPGRTMDEKTDFNGTYSFFISFPQISGNILDHQSTTRINRGFDYMTKH